MVTADGKEEGRREGRVDKQNERKQYGGGNTTVHSH